MSRLLMDPTTEFDGNQVKCNRGLVLGIYTDLAHVPVECFLCGNKNVWHLIYFVTDKYIFDYLCPIFWCHYIFKLLNCSTPCCSASNDCSSDCNCYECIDYSEGKYVYVDEYLYIFV